MRQTFSHRFPLNLLLVMITASAWVSPPAYGGDEVIVTFDSALRQTPATGRLILLTAPASGGADPLDAPFWNDPQPICSIAVEDVKPGEPMRLGDVEATFPGPMSEWSGSHLVRAVLDVDRTTGGFANSSENLVSDPVLVVWRAGEDDRLQIVLTSSVEVPSVQDTERVKEVVLRSERLSAFFGRDVFLRAGVVLPAAYREQPERRFATVYHSPGFGGRHFAAWERSGSSGAIDEQVVHVYLDADGPNSHHLFVNSANNGPVGDALVHELIPHLEASYRLATVPEARLLTGHSSGGFTSVWLQVNYTEFFGGCWATGPDPVDFRAFQLVNIYDDTDAYVDALGRDRPSVVINGRTVCTIRQENLMEFALDPHGGAGQQWSSWMACFSTRQADGYPAPIWDIRSGRINPDLRDHWKQFDVRRLLESRWDEIGPLICRRLRIICGDQDNFSLHEAVRLLRDALEQLPGWKSEWDTAEERAAHGYITLVPGGTHMNLRVHGVNRRINEEMLLHLRNYGLVE